MFFELYPNTDFHNLNLDWIVATIKKLDRDMDDFEAMNKITFDGAWDITKQYKPWTIVNDNGAGYISIKPVPAGILLTNADYWRGVVDYTATIADLQNRVVNLENKTIMDYTGDGIQYPSDNPMGDQREYLVIRVPETVNKFVDNVIGIQNESHGAYGGNPDVYGNAAIAFFDKAQVERGAIGYSRENSIQPAGYVPNTLYIEVGNPFGDAGTDTDFRVIATNSTGFTPGYFYPFEHVSTTGATNIRGRGDKHVNLYGGAIIDNEHSTYAKLYMGGILTPNRSGIGYNIESAENNIKYDDNEDAMVFTVGESYDNGVLGKAFKGFTFSKSDANTSTYATLMNLGLDGRIYHGKIDYTSFAFNGVHNVSNQILATVPTLCVNNNSTNQPAEIIWNDNSSLAFIEFQYGPTIDASSLKGSIKYNSGSGTVDYNTTSDYRVKKITGNLEHAIDMINDIKVYTGKIGNAENETAFCLAHELQEVFAPCVTGTKDAVDEEGNMILQQVDYSKLIPVIIEALKEVICRLN